MNKEQIIKEIQNNVNDYFGYSHFSIGNMKDYTLMECTINDLTDVYPLSSCEAVEIVETLTH